MVPKLTKEELTEILAKLIVELQGKNLLTDVSDVIRELLQYKYVEERLGIDIVTAFKVSVDGCYYLYEGKIEHFIPNEREFARLNFDNKSIDLMHTIFSRAYRTSYYVETRLFFERYGKVWALTKDELLRNTSK